MNWSNKLFMSDKFIIYVINIDFIMMIHFKNQFTILIKDPWSSFFYISGRIGVLKLYKRNNTLSHLYKMLDFNREKNCSLWKQIKILVIFNFVHTKNCVLKGWLFP